MPYLTQQDKEGLAARIENPETPIFKHSGELNYMFTNAIIQYFKEHPNYQGINDILGALEGAKLEFYRRVVAIYEDSKALQNGDVYKDQ